MIVAGVMSGTSADGINVALVRIGEPAESGSRDASGVTSGSGGKECPSHTIRLVAHAEYPYPARVRSEVLAAMNASRASVADLARLNFLLGELYADAVLATQRRFKSKADLIGCHGQTLYHQGEAARFLGRSVAATWQTGEAAVIAARVGVPVVSDFRPADMAAGGKGAPLVPYLDYLLFGDPQVGRIVQNIGGIANLTAIPAGADASDVVAFDTGPGNMVIDAVTEKLFGKPFDRSGKIAASGRVLEPVLQRLLRRPFFRKPPPKAAGREQFGREFVGEFLRNCRGARKQDVVATATALTAKSIADAVGRFLLKGIATPRRSAANARPGAAVPTFQEMIVSGGGVRNAALVKMLSNEVTPLGVQIRFSDEFGLPSEAKEAVAFAVLAYETWHRRPANVPSATGAKRGAVLGKISFV
ncbi:MAG: anhydro-N-acetylmuramic acid kinase [Acidobacteria bacterium]|nr:MAG: anhydro-N-acetylmuramic acid kinase [Acidobacteriota bacterium]